MPAIVVLLAVGNTTMIIIYVVSTLQSYRCGQELNYRFVIRHYGDEICPWCVNNIFGMMPTRILHPFNLLHVVVPVELKCIKLTRARRAHTPHAAAMPEHAMTMGVALCMSVHNDNAVKIKTKMKTNIPRWRSN